MKFSNLVTSSRRKNRKKLFQSDSNQRRKIMSSLLSKNLREKYQKKSLPIRKDDEVKIMRGIMRGRIGKVVQCHRKSFSIYVDKISRLKTGKSISYLPISPSNVIITGLSMTNERKMLLLNKSVT
jgi:large subunit ribosomal protein L26e